MDVPVAEMPSFVVVLPAIDPGLAHECVESMSPVLRSRCLLIDNTGLGRIAYNHEGKVRWTLAPPSNLGVPKSWNKGAVAAAATESEYLIILSQSIRFGERGGCDFLATLSRERPSMFCDAQFGWKLIAVATAAFAKVGPFDTRYTPAYYEESDWMYRAHLAGLTSPWYNNLPGRTQDVAIDAMSAGNAVALHRGLVPGLDYGAQAAIFETKWGGPPRFERFVYPYNDATLDWTFIGAYPAEERA